MDSRWIRAVFWGGFGWIRGDSGGFASPVPKYAPRGLHEKCENMWVFPQERGVNGGSGAAGKIENSDTSDFLYNIKKGKASLTLRAHSRILRPFGFG